MSKVIQKKETNTISKEDFIGFLADMKPGELNKLIEEKGKPISPKAPMFFFPKPDEK